MADVLSMTALKSAAMAQLAEDYRRLSVDEILADLPSLDREDLHFVRSLEEMAGWRRRVGDRIVDLLDALDRPDTPSAGSLSPAPVAPTRPEPAAPLLVDIRPGRRRLIRPRIGLLAGIAAVVAAAVMAFVAVGGSGGGSPGRTPAAGASPTSTRVQTAAPTALGLDPLEGLLVAVPPGYVQQADTAGHTGPSDLAEAAGDDGAAGAEATLGKDGFVHGFQRMWLNAAQFQINALIYQFKDASGAASYSRDVIGHDRSLSQFQFADFSVPGVPGAIGLTRSATGDVTAIVVLTKGPYLVRLAVNSSSGNGVVDAVRRLAQAQYGIL